MPVIKPTRDLIGLLRQRKDAMTKKRFTQLYVIWPVPMIYGGYLQITSYFRFLPPFIVEPIRKMNRSLHHCINPRIQRRHTNKHKFPGELFQIGLVINVYTADIAEYVLDVVRTLVVDCQGVGTCEETKVGGFNGNGPETRFGAEGTVAFCSAFGNVRVNVEGDGFAMAASVVCL